MATVGFERVAIPHLYPSEQITWIGLQPLRRASPRRLAAAIPGALVIVGAIAMAISIAEDDPAALMGARGLALPGMLTVIAASGAAYIWGIAYRPIAAYRGVRRLYCVVTDR
ncbi:MAG: hypothetical protein H5U40_19320, partial [Polyangiaceae bacterium]|nr:hypothetical protein [Polyangiaceae bacterium]